MARKEVAAERKAALKVKRAAERQAKQDQAKYDAIVDVYVKTPSGEIRPAKVGPSILD